MPVILPTMWLGKCMAMKARLVGTIQPWKNPARKRQMGRILRFPLTKGKRTERAKMAAPRKPMAITVLLLSRKTFSSRKRAGDGADHERDLHQGHELSGNFHSVSGAEGGLGGEVDGRQVIEGLHDPAQEEDAEDADIEDGELGGDLEILVRVDGVALPGDFGVGKDGRLLAQGDDHQEEHTDDGEDGHPGSELPGRSRSSRRPWGRRRSPGRCPGRHPCPGSP